MSKQAVRIDSKQPVRGRRRVISSESMAVLDYGTAIQEKILDEMHEWLLDLPVDSAVRREVRRGISIATGKMIDGFIAPCGSSEQ